jgi:hypothetical protein
MAGVLIACLGDIYKLTKLCILNSYVLAKYQRVIKYQNTNIIVIFFGFINKTFAQFYKIIPKLESIDKYEQDRLKKIYQSVCIRCSHQKPKYDPLSAHLAIELQSSIIKNEFQRLFGLEATKDESYVLGKYGSADIAIKEFLEYCGFGSSSLYVIIFYKLPQYFSSFIKIASELRHNNLVVREKFLRIKLEKANSDSKNSFLGKARYLWLVLSYKHWCHMYWRYDEAHRTKRLRVDISEQYKKYYDYLISSKMKAAKISEDSIFIIAAYEIHFISITMLLLDAQNNINENSTNLRYKKNERIIALQRLEMNFDSIIQPFI